MLGGDFLCKLNTHVTFFPQKQQLYVEAQLEHDIQLQVLQTCLEGPKGKLFPHKINEQVDQDILANGAPGGMVNIQTIEDIHPMVPNHVILLDNPNVASQNTTILNLATLLSDSEGDSAL